MGGIYGCWRGPLFLDAYHASPHSILPQGTTLAVGSAGYVAGNDCGVPAAQGVYTMTVQTAGWADKTKAPRLSPRAECGVNPVVDSTLPYSLYALNQKCVEAQRVMVPAGRCLVDAAANGEKKEEEGEKCRTLNGALVVSEDECWQACSANGYTDGSYFYVYSPGASLDDECYCCAT